jgi:serine/threonine protein kinase
MEQQNVLEQILEGSREPTHLPLETLRKITEDFSVDRLIGEGGFGKVYKGVVGNKNVAVKRIRSSMTINEKLFRREVGNQMDLNHENVVRFLGLCSHTVEIPMKNPEAQGRYILAEIRERLLCFEFVSNGSLDKYITGMIDIYQCSSSYAPLSYLIFLAASFNSWLTIYVNT